MSVNILCANELILQRAVYCTWIQQPLQVMPSELLPSYDYTIVGAGASGLWLALALLDEGLLEDHTLCIVEAKVQKHNDRTWCYWSETPLDTVELLQHKWSHFVHPANPSIGTAIEPYHYYHLRSADFYAQVWNRLERCSNVTRLIAEVKQFNQNEDVVYLESSAGNWKSKYAFVSAMPRPLDPLRNKVPEFLGNNVSWSSNMLWQSFVGWRIRTSDRKFNAKTATLMRFDVEQQGHTQFIYELPFSENEVLIELTRFGKEPLQRDDAEPLLRKHLEALGIQYTIEEWEVGAIPMTPALDMKRTNIPVGERVVYIGTPGGAVKPTTGYAFKRMALYATRLAKALRQGHTLPTMRRKQRFRIYDILLLQILYASPSRGKGIFLQLFRSQPLHRVLRFLDEETSLREELLIFVRLPIRLFLRSLLQYIRQV